MDNDAKLPITLDNIGTFEKHQEKKFLTIKMFDFIQNEKYNIFQIRDIIDLQNEKRMQMNLGDLIRESRIKQKMTLEKLSQKIGVSQPVISEWERNNKKPKADKLILLIKELKIKKKDLISCV